MLALTVSGKGNTEDVEHGFRPIDEMSPEADDRAAMATLHMVVDQQHHSVCVLWHVILLADFSL
jgi:hypothetical protein